VHDGAEILVIVRVCANDAEACTYLDKSGRRYAAQSDLGLKGAARRQRRRRFAEIEPGQMVRRDRVNGTQVCARQGGGQGGQIGV